jgi:hypothetical protein
MHVILKTLFHNFVFHGGKNGYLNKNNKAEAKASSTRPFKNSLRCPNATTNAD